MSLEQLQDYALKLTEENNVLKDNNVCLEKEKQDLLGVNLELQKRNNALFMKVEQQQIDVDNDQEPQPEPVATLEDVAINIFKNKEIRV